MSPFPTFLTLTAAVLLILPNCQGTANSSVVSFALGGVGTTTKTTQKNAIPSATQSMTGDRDQNTQPVVEDAEEFDYTRLI